jgi:hypothetical protein
MPAAANAVFGKNALFTFDDDPFTNEINEAEFTPQQETQSYKTLVPDGTQNDTDNAVWSLNITGLAIHKAGGLAAAMRAAAGTEVEVVLQQVAGVGQPTATATIIVPAIPFGVKQGQWSTMTIVCPVVGEPAWGTSA